MVYIEKENTWNGAKKKVKIKEEKCNNASNFSKVYDIYLFVYFGLGMQWLDVGSQFPDQGLNLGCSSESGESYPLDHQGTPV